MIIRIYDRVGTVHVQRRVMRVIRVYDRNIPEGISESEFTQKGGILAGSGAGAFGELPPGSAGQYLTPDPTAPMGLKYETPSIAISDPTNFLINGGFHFAQRTTPGTLTTVSDNAYGADRWKQSRENADLQYQRNDATSESGLTSLYYGKYKKITNAGKFMVFQILEGVNSIPLRGKTVIFQAKLKASGSKTIRMAILELQTGGTIDTIPSPVSSWNVDSTDPTLGSNLAVVTGAESKAVTTSWQVFSVSVTVPATSKNVIVALWADADFSVADELNIAEAGLFLGASLISWAPRLLQVELGLCQRFYWKSFDLDTLPAQNSTFTGALRFIAGKAGATAQYGTFILPVRQRTSTPTVTGYNPAAANAQVRDGIAVADCSATSVSVENQTLFLNCTGNASTAVGNRLHVHVTSDAEL